MRMLLCFALLASFGVVAQSVEFVDGRERRCEPVTLDMCKSVGYNATMMPNRFNHETQEEAGLEVNQFVPLVEMGCSPHLRFLLCSLYLPICLLPSYDKPLLPCRSVCRDVQNNCEPIMLEYGFGWPENLRCDNLPDGGNDDSDNLCMAPPQIEKKEEKEHRPSVIDRPSIHRPTSVCECRCSGPFVMMLGDGNEGKMVGNVSQCTYPCHSPFLHSFDASIGRFVPDVGRQHLLHTWMCFWAISCALVTLLTTLTFAVDMSRVAYPQRPIFYLSFCYLMVAIAYIIRLGSGNMSCTGLSPGDIARSGASNGDVCTAVFVLNYYFGMASCIWWCTLCFTWFLAAGLKWGEEPIKAYAKYYHMFAWGLPAIKTLAIIGLEGVDGDPLSGMCGVGNTNVHMMTVFLIVPQMVYLLLGVAFLFAGLFSLVRIHRVIKQSTRHTIYRPADRLQQLIGKLGLFSVLYTIPAALVIGGLLYEREHREEWEESILCPCKQKLDTSTTVFAWGLVRHASSLVVGIALGVWVCSAKTLHMWRRIILCQCGSSYPTKQHIYSEVSANTYTEPQLCIGRPVGAYAL